MNCLNYVLYLSVFCVSIIHHGKTLTIESVLEGSCSQMSNQTMSEFVDENWIQSTPRWYIVLLNKYTLYRLTLHHVEEDEKAFANISEHQMYYESCLTYGHDHDTIKIGSTGTLLGYKKGLESHYKSSKHSDGVHDFIPIPLNKTRSHISPYVAGVGRYYVSLTDNKSFLVYTGCYFTPNQKTFAVLANTPTLPPSTVQRIRTHVINQEFDPRHIAHMRFDSCKPGVLN